MAKNKPQKSDIEVFREIEEKQREKLSDVNDIYTGKFKEYLKDLEPAVKKLKKQTTGLKGTRAVRKERTMALWASFNETHTKRFEALVKDYEDNIKKVLGRDDLDKYWTLIKNVEAWLTAFYDTMYPVTPPFIALKRKARMGRGMEIQYAGYNLRKDGNPYRKHLEDYEGLDVPALFPLDKYCFPYDWKKFKFIREKLDEKFGEGAGKHKYHGTPHGPEHTHHALKYAHRIVRALRRKHVKLNEHEVYTMVGWHDFWRVVDMDPNVYNIVAEDFFPEELAYAKHAGKKPEDFVRPDSLAKGHFNRIEKELRETLEGLEDEWDAESLGFVGAEALTALEAWSQIRGIMEKTKEKVKEVKKPNDEQMEKIRADIFTQLQDADDLLKKSIDPELHKELSSMAASFTKDMKSEEKLRAFTKKTYDFLDSEGAFIMKAVVRPYLNRIKSLVQDINTHIIIERPQTNRELTKIEDEALEKVKIVRNFMETFKPAMYEHTWEQEIDLLEKNILIRRKLNLAGRAHHLRGSGSEYKRAPGDKESKLSVPIFLDMFGHYFLFLRIMNFIKIHDLKLLSPETLEGKIAQDADMLDGIGPEAVERTDDVGLEYGDKYWDEDAPIEDRKSYIESGGGVPPPDTMTVLLSLCYCWPKCLNTGPARAIVEKEKKVRRMEREIIRYSRVKKGLLSFQITKLRKLMKEFKNESAKWVLEGKKKAPEDAKKLEMRDLYWE